MPVKPKHIVLTACLVGAGAFAAHAGKTAQAGKRLKLFIESVKPAWPNGGMLPVTLTLRLYNHTDTPITVKHLAISLFQRERGSDWSSIGANAPQDMQIPAGESLRSITVNVGLFDLGITAFGAIRSLVESKMLNTDLRVVVEGTVLGFRRTLTEQEFLFSEGQNLQGLGLVANHRRKINPKDTYAKYFDGLDSVGKTVGLPDGTQSDTQKDIARLAKEFAWQVKRLAPILAGNNLEITSENIWKHCYQNYQYRPDAKDREQVRSPTRSYKDRVWGIDCDCFATLISAILQNLGIRHWIRMTAYTEDGAWGHIYIVVPKRPAANPEKREDYYVIDPVLDRYDHEQPFNRGEAKDLEVMPSRDIKTRREFLNGPTPQAEARETATAMAPTQFTVATNTLVDAPGDGASLERADYENFMALQKQQLVETLEMLEQDPILAAQSGVSEFEVQGMVDLLAVWDDPVQRFRLLDSLVDQEVQRGGGIVPLISDWEASDGQVVHLNGQGLKGFFANIKKEVDKVVQAVKNSKFGKAIDRAHNKLINSKEGKVLGTASHIITRLNPVIAAVRGGVIHAVLKDEGNMASRMHVGWLKQHEAIRKKIPLSVWREAVAANKKIEYHWRSFGGQVSKLYEAVKKGQGKKGLGEPALAAGVTIAGVIALITAILNAVNWDAIHQANSDGSLDVGKVLTSVDPNAIQTALEQFQKGSSSQNTSKGGKTSRNGGFDFDAIMQVAKGAQEAISSRTGATVAPSNNLVIPNTQRSTQPTTPTNILGNINPWVFGGGLALALGGTIYHIHQSNKSAH